MKFLLVRILLSLSIVVGLGSLAYANDQVEWNDYRIYTDYDSSDEELEIRFSVYSDGNPNEDFELDMDVGDEQCIVELEYSSFHLDGICILDIDEEDVRGVYNTSLEIENLDDDAIEFSDSTVTFEVAGFEEEFDWDDLLVDASYDEEDEKLELKIYLEDVSREPDFEYEIEFKIDNKTFKKTFSWDEDEDELSFSFTTSIDSDDIENDYEIDFEVLNTDDDDEEVGDGELEFDVEIISEDDDFDWDELEYTALYDEDRQRLEVILFLEDITSQPNQSYEAQMELDREDYDKTFRYDSDEDILSATFSINIEEEDIERDYDIDVQIENRNNDEVFDDEFNIDVEELSTADDFDWDNLLVSASYDEDDEKLYVEMVLRNINSAPVFTYTSDLSFEDEDDSERFIYNSAKDELRASFDFRIDEDDIEDEYELDIRIEDNNDDRVYKEDIDVTIGNYSDEEDIVDSEYNWENIEIDFDYSTDTEYLTIEVELDGIDNYPSFDYFVDLNVSGITQAIGSKLRYDSQNKRLYGTYNIYIRENDIEDDYNMTMFINDEDDNLQYLLTDRFDVEIDGDDADVNEENISENRKKAVDNFTGKIYARYSNRASAKAYFKLVIATFNTFADQNPSYRSAIDDINFLLQLEIDSN